MRTHASRGRSPPDSYSRSYSRSPSPRGSYTRNTTRTRSRTPSYSDSFESEDEKPTRTPRRIGPPPRKGGRRGLKKGAKDKSGRVSPRMLDVVARRMLSAKRVKVNDLRNEVEMLKQQIEELKKENKILQSQSRRQERALNKVDGAQSELPSLLERHNEELRAVKEQLRKVKEKYEASSRKNKELDGNLTRVTAQLHKLKELTEDKNLKEREVLTRRVNQLEDDLSERDTKIRDLERYIENLQKNHRHELSIEVHRHKDTQKRLNALEAQLTTTESDLKEKEKILEIQNIYSQRVVRAPHHLHSSGSTPLHFPSRRKTKTSNSAEIGLTPREKAKLYEQKRRQDERQKALAGTDIEFLTSHIPSENRTKRMQESNSMQNISENDRDSVGESSGVESETEISMAKEQERLQQEQREAEERQRKAEEAERQEQEEEMERLRFERQEEERRQREEERQRREEEERRRREEEERQRREEEEAAAARRRKEFEELQVREAEERKKKDALLAKLKALDSNDTNNTTNGSTKQEEKKEEFFLTRQSSGHDKRTYAAPKHHLNDEEESIPEIPTLDLATGQQSSGRREKQQQQQQQPFQPTQVVSATGGGGRNSSSTIHSSSSTSSKKTYNFKDQVENMHAGKPAYDDVSVPYLDRQKRVSASSSVAGEDDPFRNAVYGRRGSNRKPPPAPTSTTKVKDKGADRENKLMEELFGSSSNTAGYEPSSIGNKPQTNAGMARSRDASPSGIGAGQAKNTTNSVLPWEVEEAGDRMLPRRASQPRNSIYPRRNVSPPPPGAIDDIEELTL